MLWCHCRTSLSYLSYLLNIKFIKFRHQGQCYDLASCEMSGIIASVGCDGRLVESMYVTAIFFFEIKIFFRNGRITCRSSEDDLACFVHRPVLQIIRHKHDGNHINEDLELSRVEAEKRRLETVDVIAEEPLIVNFISLLFQIKVLLFRNMIK